MSSNLLRDAHRIVVKVGSSLVTNEGRGLDEAAIQEWSRQLAALVRGDESHGGQRREVIMVSSVSNERFNIKIGVVQRKSNSL
jgi:glutamate 5-kinase